MAIDLKFRTLQTQDATALLEFELRNRAWFEQYVLPRSESVYSLEGMSDHIRICLDDYAAGTMHPFLILDAEDNIIGRANLKDIDVGEGTTEIGYRISQTYVGQGVATKAVHFLKAVAYDEWKLTCLWAFVTTENSASARVLEKAGFAKGDLIVDRSLIGNRLLACHRYKHARV